MNNQRFKTVCIMLALVLLVSCVALFLISTTADAAVIKQGSSGETVRKIQTKLKNWGYYTVNRAGIIAPVFQLGQENTDQAEKLGLLYRLG